MISGQTKKRRNWTPAMSTQLLSMMQVGTITASMQAQDIKAKDGIEFDIFKGYDDHILQGHLDKIRLTQSQWKVSGQLIGIFLIEILILNAFYRNP